jgi:hypothetical protein
MTAAVELNAVDIPEAQATPTAEAGAVGSPVGGVA